MKRIAVLIISAMIVLFVVSACHSGKRCAAYQDVSQAGQEQSDKAHM